MDDETCPHCEKSLRGSAIPEKYLQHYGGSRFYSLKIGHEIRGVYDGVLYWSCPFCKNTWHRFTDPSLRQKAEAYVS